MLGILKKTFSETSTFKKHELILTLVKEFQCNTCQSTFSEAGTLLVYTGVKYYECNTCKQIFSVAGTLKKKELSHTGVKECECDNCQKRFSGTSNLNTHELICTGVIGLWMQYLSEDIFFGRYSEETWIN